MPQLARSRPTARRHFAAGVVLALLLPGVAAAEPLGTAFNPLGDGSETTNPDLLPGYLDCENCAGQAPPDLDLAPYEAGAPWFTVDWSLGLRGALVQDADGAEYGFRLLPAIGLRHDTLRGGYGVTANAEITTTPGGEFRIDALRAGFDLEQALDAATGLEAGLDLSRTRKAPEAPTTIDAITGQPVIWSGAGEVAVSRAFGQFVATARAGGSRTLHGPTTRADGTVTDNNDQDNWRGEAGLRLGYQLTPILTAFIDGSVGYQRYDTPAPGAPVSLDAADYQLRAGLAADWQERLEAEASIGLGLRRFADPALAEVTSTLYDASVSFRPDETLTLRAGFATGIGAPGPDSPGVARLEYAATADLAYQVNSWLGLRAAVSWRQADLIGSAVSERGHGFGAGLDYRLNEFTTFNADYGYDYSETAPAPGAVKHEISVGITVSR